MPSNSFEDSTSEFQHRAVVIVIEVRRPFLHIRWKNLIENFIFLVKFLPNFAGVRRSGKFTSFQYFFLHFPSKFSHFPFFQVQELTSQIVNYLDAAGTAVDGANSHMVIQSRGRQ